MLSRRTLLKSLAGAALLGPFVRETWAQSAKPARLVIVLECNGIYPVAFLSASGRTALGGEAVGGRRNFTELYADETRVLTGDALSSALCLGPLAASGSDPSLEERSAVVLG